MVNNQDVVTLAIWSNHDLPASPALVRHWIRHWIVALLGRWVVALVGCWFAGAALVRHWFAALRGHWFIIAGEAGHYWKELVVSVTTS